MPPPVPLGAPPANLVTSWAPNASAASGLLTSGAASLVHSAGAQHSLLCCSDGLCDSCKTHPALHAWFAQQVPSTGCFANLLIKGFVIPGRFCLLALLNLLPATRRLAAVHLTCLH